jgi:hypothetical protein
LIQRERTPMTKKVRDLIKQFDDYMSSRVSWFFESGLFLLPSCCELFSNTFSRKWRISQIELWSVFCSGFQSSLGRQGARVNSGSAAFGIVRIHQAPLPTNREPSGRSPDCSLSWSNGRGRGCKLRRNSNGRPISSKVLRFCLA